MSWFRKRGRVSSFSMLLLIIAIVSGSQILSTMVALAANTVVTPTNLDGWIAANVRTDATVAITTNQPRGEAPNSFGSLEFTTNTITPGQDKADYAKYWGPVAGRTLGNLSALSYEFYRASSSTTGQHQVPAFRLGYQTTGGQTGYLVWENVYNGGSTATPVPTDQWISNNILLGNFWMREFSPGATIQNYGVTLAEWKANNDDGTGTIVGQPGDATVHVLDADTYITGIEVGVGSGWGATFRGFVDNIGISFGADAISANFETVLQCTTTCYADAVGGNDANGGTSIADAKKTIQAAIDNVQPGGAVHVLPGSYSETAANRMLYNNTGPYQFGLFIGDDKDGISVIGVDGSDAPITNFANVLASVATNATNNFGQSGIFVEGDNVTIQGLKLLDNAINNSKTIEILGNAFALRYSHIAVSDGGAIYFGDWRFDTNNNVSHIQSYTIEDNFFDLGAQVALSNGAGFSGPVSGRIIKNNQFVNADNWPSISFNGAGGVPWYVYAVGGAMIAGNEFTNTYVGTGPGVGHIRARGTYTEGEFDWTAWWNTNTFNKAVVTLSGTYPPFVVRPYAYTSGSYTFTNVRRIGATIQDGVNDAAATDTVLASAGTFPENVTINKDDLTIQGTDQATTIIQGDGTTCNVAGLATVGSRSNITIADLSVTGFLDGIQIPTGPIANIVLEDVSASTNCRHGIWVQAFGIDGLRLTRVTASDNNPASLAAQSGRGLWIINGVKQNITIENGVYQNNRLVGIDVSDGNVTGLAITGNTVSGNGDAGISVLGAKAPGANLISNNRVTNNGRFGIEIKNSTGNGSDSGAGSVVVASNVVSRTVTATDLRDHGGIVVIRRAPNATDNADQPSGIVLINNEVRGYQRAATAPSNQDGFGILVEGINNIVSNNIVAGNDIGIQIQGGCNGNQGAGSDGLPADTCFGRGDAAAGSALVNLNSISGNGIGLRTVGTVTPSPLNGERNWWGSNTGPQPTGSGDIISGNIDFNPWLCSGQDTSSATGFQTNAQNSPCTAPVGTITVTKYNDSNGNGAFEGGETGLSGWSITVKQGATTVGTGATNASGIVTFSALPVGSYTVCETPKANWTNTDPSNGSGCKTATVSANNTTNVILGNVFVSPTATPTVTPTTTPTPSNTPTNTPTATPTNTPTPMATATTGTPTTPAPTATPTTTPTAVPTVPAETVIVSFVATLQDSTNASPSVLLTWETSLEVNTNSFYIYRADGSGNDVFIPLTGPFPSVGTQGGSYQYIDTAVQFGMEYSYLLVERKQDDTLIEYRDLIQVIIIGTVTDPFGVWLPLIMK